MTRERTGIRAKRLMGRTGFGAKRPGFDLYIHVYDIVGTVNQYGMHIVSNVINGLHSAIHTCNCI
jgi:hypothetical protein